MFKTLLAALAVLCASASAACATAPLTAYGKLPAVEDMVLSPNGKTFAFVFVEGDQRRLFVRTVDGALVQSFSLGAIKVRQLDWVGDDHLLIFASNTLRQTRYWGNSYQYEALSAISLNIKTGSHIRVFANHADVLGNVLGYYGGTQVADRWYGYFRTQQFSNDSEDNPSRINHAGGGSELGLFRVDLDTGALTKTASSERSGYDWVMDSRGRIVARTMYQPATNTWSLLSGDSGDHVVLSRVSETADIDALGLGRTPNTVLLKDQSGDTDEAIEVPLDGTSKPQVLFDGLDNISRLDDPNSRLLLGGVDDQHGKSSFFDPLLEKRFQAASKPFVRYHVVLKSYDAAFDRLILFTDAADDAGTYWLVDLTTGKASELAESYPDIHPQDVGPTSLVHYKAADGLQIEGVLTLPPARQAEHLPLVVLPHGGPIGISDKLGFDWWAQAFASKGYAVLQPNYRGSGGAGAAFRKAGYGEGGRKMQTDQSDGVAMLAAQGTVDPKRVCIVGGSYGGYAALAGVTLQHGVYRCAVSYGGVSDLGAILMRAGGNVRNNVTGRWERRALGATWSGDPVLHTYSPLYQAAKADAPILLIHGRDDTVVPIAESEKMDGALRASRKPESFIRLDGEDHWLSTPHTRMQMLQAAVDFVVAHDPPA